MPTKRSSRLAAVLACVWVVGYATSVLTQTTSDIVNTKHNLSVSGPGTVRASSETRICVFCHTPHNATPSSPLWNKDIQPQVYTVYTSPTLRAGPLPQPTGPTKLCLSCHDGTIAMGAVVNPAGGITMAAGPSQPLRDSSNIASTRPERIPPESGGCAGYPPSRQPSPTIPNGATTWRGANNSSPPSPTPSASARRVGPTRPPQPGRDP